MEPKVVLDTIWVLMTAMLVFFMNLGFATVEAGMQPAKNCVNILSKNFVVFKLIGAILGGHRPDPAVEVDGLDVPEMGLPGYVGVKLDKHSETPLSR